MKEKRGTIPVLFIEAENIPQAHHRATNSVLKNGMTIRTQYDRKDSQTEEFIDPPSKDAKVLISIDNPFNQPRYPIILHSEIGAYIAEIIGAKNHLVVPYETLIKQLAESGEGELTAKQWPYHYNQRLTSWPLHNTSVNQMTSMLEKLTKDPITRRAVATTRHPQIDSQLHTDLPCLGEVKLRCVEDSGDLYLNMDTVWRSRDLFKAWPDNVIGLTFWQQMMAQSLGKMMDREVKVGGYTDYSHSLHIYGQDMSPRFDKYVQNEESNVLSRAFSSEDAKELMVIPQLQELLTPKKIGEWGFPAESTSTIKSLISRLESGELTA